MSNGVALYYPHIEFRNTEWLKWALLFWDNGIRRIVPEDVEPLDSNEIKEAIDADAVSNVNSAPYLDPAATEFETHLDRYLKLADQEAPKQGEITSSPIVNSYLEIDSAMRLSKIHPDVAQRLQALDLAYTRRDTANGPLLSAPRPLVALYMTILARKISESTKAPVITDRPTYARMANEIIGGTIHQDVAESSNVVQHLFVDFIDPERIRRLSMAQVLQIRENLLPAMKSFREKLEDTVSTLSSISDPIAYKDGLSDARKSITNAVKIHKRECAASNLEFFQKSLGITGLSLLPSIAGIAGHVLAPATAGASLVAAFALSALIYKQRRTIAADTFSYQYVLSLDKMLG